MASNILWQPSASIAIIHARAAMLAQIRAFFYAVGVLEVETPTCLVHANTDPAIESLTTCFTGPNHRYGLPLYLHTSPEFAMKRLLAAGIGSIYQICRVYRNGELGAMHHPEFTMLEWYRPGFNYQQLMDEVVNLIQTLVKQPIIQQRLSYVELFERYLNLNLYSINLEQVHNCAVQLKISGIESMNLYDMNMWLDLLLTHGIQPYLPKNEMLFIYDYPVSQAAGAYIRPGSPPVAERFELYLGSMEIANGYQELIDAREQEQRFNTDLVTRQQQNLPLVPMDSYLLEALQVGLPNCAGVALGLDRLLMWLTDTPHIEQVLTFPLSLVKGRGRG